MVLFFIILLFTHNLKISFSSKGLLNHIDFAYKISSLLYSCNSGPVSGLHYFLQLACKSNCCSLLIVMTHNICLVLPSLQSTSNTVSPLRLKNNLKMD